MAPGLLTPAVPYSLEPSVHAHFSTWALAHSLAHGDAPSLRDDDHGGVIVPVRSPETADDEGPVDPLE